ncbi:hypothetical protein ACT4WX_20170 (plasmid) [Acinetobacter baumannii]|uniref:hypothetical protein n=1 Tax=Acinetobacter baumannii TaxID=470 RepID=UPI00044906AC|nr:hypothetical protein [Acinetobacter baumannii]EXA83689.1 putative membrane protein [Acinetobacter baumannii 118362]MDC5637358.1 hypothetical protein [Acinetobacter baumannii]HEO1790798.1 hypothetical protein [Acinetobacter baumannii]
MIEVTFLTALLFYASIFWPITLIFLVLFTAIAYAHRKHPVWHFLLGSFVLILIVFLGWVVHLNFDGVR